MSILGSENTSEVSEGAIFLEQNFEKREVPNLIEICSREKCDEKDLGGVVQSRVDKILDYCEEHSSVVDIELNDDIDFLYQVYVASKNETDDGLAKSLQSYESFVEHYVHEIDRKTLSNFRRRVNNFVDTVVHPSRILMVYSKDHRMFKWLGKRNIYMYEGDWIQVDPGKYPDSRDYIEKGVLEEVDELSSEGYRAPGIFHVSGSAALEGIGKHGAILSARKAIELGESVKTGEYNSYIGNDGISVTGRETGLNSIFAARKLKTGYGMVRWFDEFDVGYGISENKLKKYLEENHPGKYSLFDYSEGITIGPEVPLGLVEVAYVDKVYIERMNEWVKQFAPHIKVVSIEAETLIQERLSGYNPKLERVERQKDRITE